MHSRQPVVKKTSLASRRLWAFRDSFKWEIHSLSRGGCKVVDKSVSG